MKRFLGILFVLVMVFSALPLHAGGAQGGGQVSAGKTYRLSLGSSTTGSTYYILAAGWANLMHLNIPGVEVSVEATPGGITNMQSMRNGDMDLGMTTTWLAGDGWNGTSWAEGVKYDNCLSMFPTHSSVLYIFTLANSGINSVMDLNGKRIATGALVPPAATRFPRCWKRWA